MRKMMLLAAMLSMALLMMSPATAMAEDLDFDGFDDQEEFYEEFYFPFFFGGGIDDVDCDGFDDDFDGGIDEDVVCVVEFDDDFYGFGGFDNYYDDFDYFDYFDDFDSDGTIIQNVG